MAYSRDYKERAVAYKAAGHTFKELREAFGIPSETYYVWKRRLESGYYDTQIKRGRKRKIDKDALKKAVEQRPDAFLKELAVEFNCTGAAIGYALQKLGITRKKNSLRTAKGLKRSVRSIKSR